MTSIQELVLSLAMTKFECIVSIRMMDERKAAYTPAATKADCSDCPTKATKAE